MTASVATRPAANLRDPKAGPKRPCGNPECHLELSTADYRRRVRQNGLCGSCFENGVTVPEAPAEQPIEPKARKASSTTRKAPTAKAKQPTKQDTPQAPAQAAPQRDEVLAEAVAVVRFAYPDITEFQAEAGLKAAVAHWANGRVDGRGIEAAAKAWIVPGQDYEQLTGQQKARATAKALPIVKSAIRAAKAHRAAPAARDAALDRAKATTNAAANAAVARARAALGG